MKLFSAVLLAALAAPAFGQYTWYFTDPMASLLTSDWATSGTFNFSSYSGYTGAYGTSSGFSSMVSTVAVPDGTSSYGVQATMHFPSGYIIGQASLLLRASSTFSSIGLPNNAYVIQLTCGGGSTWLQIQKIVSGTVTTLTGNGVTCSDGMTLRADINDSGQITTYVNGVFWQYTQDSSLTTGAPGVALGTSSGMVVSQVQLGPADRIAPGPIGSALSYSVYSSHVDFSWTSVPDDTNGSGTAFYQFLQNGNFGTNTTGYSWSDTTVQPGNEYVYQFIVYDRFFNSVTQTVTVDIPITPYTSPTPTDGRRVGVRSTGAYWGASTEQIDVLSGNVNFTIPLLKPQARSGWGVNFNLAYNSQNWRQDSGGIWNLGEDVGYGYGWKLLAGSITPIYIGSTLSYYSFVDSSGAEYRLNQNSGGIWSSVESVYVTYNPSNSTLYFRDGSFWVMGCTSATSEPDSGSLYPTVMEDTNGNQITILYMGGMGVGGTNSSARIGVISDVRGGGGNSYAFSYNYTYSPPHLTSITSSVGTPESYSFSYGGTTLAAPFSPYTCSTGCGSSVRVLDTVTFTSLSQSYSLGYSSDNSVALVSATLPYGGGLTWSYQNITYGNGATFREVSQRQLSADGSTYTTYPFTHDSSPGNSTHQYTIITDPGGVGEKEWMFSQTGANTGMVTEYQGLQLPGPVAKTQNNFTWSQDSPGNLYISSTLTTLDPGQSYQAQKQTSQNVDVHGNVTDLFQYDWNSLTSPSRIYSYTYLNSSAYTSLNIFNRLATAKLNGNTLVSNSYDTNSLSAAPSGITSWDSTYASVTTRGNLTNSTAVNNVTSTNYDQTGTVTNVTQNGVSTSVSTTSATYYAAPSQLTVGSLTTSLSWSTFLGLTNATGPNGDSSAVSYDPSSGRPTTSTSPYGAVTTYTYSNSPFTTLASTAAASGTHWTKTIADGLGRTITVQTGDSSSTKSQTDTVYGSCACSPTGKMIQQSMPHVPTASPVYTTYTYDGIGRTVSVLAPDGASTTTYLYQGNTVKVTDPAGKWKIFTMDAFGHLTEVDEPNPGSTPPPPISVAPPTFSPAPGTYGSSQTVSLSSSTSGATIRYTTDGSTPTETHGTVYSGTFSVSATTSINAIAYLSGMADSSISSVSYTISSSSGPAWYNTGWGYRKPITIAHGQVSGSSALTNFPTLVSWSSDSNLASAAQSTGNDILFTDSLGNKLNHEIEKYTSSSGQLTAWVQVSSVSPSADTVIYMYYGNSSASNQQNATGTWSSNYKGVWHLNGGGSTTSSIAFDNAAQYSISSSTGYGPFTESYSIGSLTNGMLLVNVYSWGMSSNWVSSVTFGGVSMTLVAFNYSSAAHSGTATYALPLGSTTSGSQTISVGLNYYWSSGITITAATYQGVAQSTPTNTSYAGNCTTMPCTSTLTTSVNNAWVFVWDTDYYGAFAPTFNSGTTQRTGSTGAAGNWTGDSGGPINPAGTFTTSTPGYSGDITTTTMIELDPATTSGGSLSVTDSTSDANNGTLDNTPTGTTGQIGGAAAFVSSSSQAVDLGNSSTLNLYGSPSLSVSLWAKRSSSTAVGTLYSNGISGVGGVAFAIGVSPATVNQVKMTKFAQVDIAISGVPADTNWHYLVGTWTGSGVNFYVDGASVGTNGNTQNILSNGGGHAFLAYDAVDTNYLSGNLDEVRVSNSVLSAAWIATEYNNQSSPGTFYSVGSQQIPGSGGGYAIPVAIPTSSIAPGTYASSQTVSLSTTTSGATIRYTTNGTTPSETVGTVYSGGITVSSTTTIKAIAYESGLADSEIASGTFTISIPSGGSDYLTYYTYDTWDNVSQVSMPRPSGTQTRTFTYNGKLLMSATNPENGTVSYTYNSYNKVATKTDAKGQVFTYTYDSLARLTNESVGSTTLYAYTYDTTPTGYPNYSQGRLTGVTYQSTTSLHTWFTEQYGYSQAGQKTNKGLVVTQFAGAGNATVDLESAYTYDNEGKMLTVQYPNSGATYTYGYDTMSRLSTLSAGSTNIITGTTYDAANRLLTISGTLAESRTYNAMEQLTHLTSSNYPNSLNVTYNYSSTQNNGKITSQTDNVSGEQVQYTYDALNRLATAGATSNSWGQAYTYDGFGNLLDQTVTAGTAPSLSVTYNPTNNLQTTDCADANGNITGSVMGSSCTSQPYSYDAKNRISVANATGTYYGYAPDNKRVWRGSGTVNEVAFWSVTGQKLSTCTLTPGGGGTTLSCVAGTTNVYFGGKLVSNGTGNVVQDRQGSIGKFYPYGQEKPSATTNGTEKFTAYFRDSETSIDYAVNRYHQPGMGRFLSTDPKRSSASPDDPGTWNRYAYVAGDPVNRTDRSGKGYANMHGGCSTWAIEDYADYGSADGPCADSNDTGCDAITNSQFDSPDVVDCNQGGDGVNAAPAPSPTPSPTPSPGDILGFLDSDCGCNVVTVGAVAQAVWTVIWGDIQQGWTTIQILQTMVGVLEKAVINPRFESRGKSDPYTLPIVNPGRDSSTGKCLPCPKDGATFGVPTPGHGGDTHWHRVIYNQNPATCDCFPVRISGPGQPGAPLQ